MTAEQRRNEARERWECVKEHYGKIALWEDAAENVYINCVDYSSEEGRRAQLAWYEAMYVLDEWADREIKARAEYEEAERVANTGLDVVVGLSEGTL